MEDAEGGLIDSELTSDTLLADVIVIRKMAFRVRCFIDALANGLKRLPVRIWDTSSRSHMGNLCIGGGLSRAAPFRKCLM